MVAVTKVFFPHPSHLLPGQLGVLSAVENTRPWSPGRIHAALQQLCGGPPCLKVVMLISTPVSPEQYSGVTGGVGERGAIFWDTQTQNHSLMRLYAHSNRVTSITLGAFATMTWINAVMLYQYVAMDSLSW